MTHFYKPYDHPDIDTISGMTDEEYHEGIRIKVVVIKHKGEDHVDDQTSVIFSQGVTNRGGRDFIFFSKITDDAILHSFVNMLMTQLGVASLSMLDDEEYRLIRVPQPKYFRQFLPPYIGLSIISEETAEWLQKEQTLKNLGIELQDVPKHTIVFYDEEGRNPTDPEFNHEAVNQHIVAGVDLALVDSISSSAEDQYHQLSDAAMAASAIHNFDSFLTPDTNNADVGLSSSMQAMNLDRMSGSVSEADIEQARREDQDWDDELRNLSNSDSSPD